MRFVRSLKKFKEKYLRKISARQL